MVRGKMGFVMAFQPTTMAKSMGANTVLPGRSTNASPVLPTACTKSLISSPVTTALAAIELAGDVAEVKGLLAEPHAPVELLDAVVATLHDFVNGSVARSGRYVKRRGRATGSPTAVVSLIIWTMISLLAAR